VLTASDVHAENTFDAPRTVAPRDVDVAVRGGVLAFTFPPASVVKITAALA